MLEISRNAIRQFRSVCRRAGIKTRSGRDPVVTVEAGTEGLSLVTGEFGIIVALRRPGNYKPFKAAVPISLFGDCEGRKDDPVMLGVAGEDVTLSWQEDRIPQQRSAKMPGEKEVFHLPEPAPEKAVNASILLSALSDASATADHNAGRYALGHLQLRGEGGRIAATDGRQLLTQSGFKFPWSEPVLIPASQVFGAPELRAAENVEVCRNEAWVIFQASDWTIALRINSESRFPAIEQVFPSGSPVATVALPSADAEFLSEALPRLPGAEETNEPVTVELNGQACVRAMGSSQTAPTELVPSNAQLAGEPVVLEINRRFLGRALALGFRTLKIYDSNSPVLFADGYRQYVVMPLTSDKPVRATPETVRIASPSLATGVSTPSTPTTTIPMTNPTTSADANSAPASAPAEQKRAKKAGPSSLEQAVALRTAFREATARANELVKTLKREQRQQRIVKETLKSLRQLQAA